MIRVTLLTIIGLTYQRGETRDIDADNVYLTEGWACFEKYIPVEGEKYRDTQFVEAIRLDRIDSMKRV